MKYLPTLLLLIFLPACTTTETGQSIDDLRYNAAVNQMLSKQNNIDEGYTAPKLLESNAPQYPVPTGLISGTIHMGNVTVKVRFTVDTNGSVTKPEVTYSDNHTFDKYAINSIKQWKFSPALKHGDPIESTIALPVYFKN